MSSTCSDPDVKLMQIRGNAILCYFTAWINCPVSRYDVSFGTCIEHIHELVCAMRILNCQCFHLPSVCLPQAGRSRVHPGCHVIRFFEGLYALIRPLCSSGFGTGHAHILSSNKYSDFSGSCLVVLLMLNPAVLLPFDASVVSEMKTVRSIDALVGTVQ